MKNKHTGIVIPKTRFTCSMLLLWIVVLQVVGYLMGMLTQVNLHPWYAQLTKSFLTPPDITFAIVWPILYVLLAVVGFNLFIEKHMYSVQQKLLFCSQLALNWLWSPVFFHLHWLNTASIILILMSILTLVLIYDLHHNHKKLAYLLIPYLIWLIFAAYLNLMICFMS